MYVAITRAKEKLYLLNAQKRMLYGKTSANAPSRFINEIRDELLEQETKNESKILNSVNKKLLYNDENDATEYHKGDLVAHITFGKGIVTDVDERFVTIAFSYKIGSKKLLKNYKGIKKV